MDLDTHVCPMCATSFAHGDGAAFALHLADCTSPDTPSPSAFRAVIINGVPVAVANGAPPTHACSYCHHVYASGTAEHVIEFHEHECARVNRRPSGASETSSSSSTSGGRPPSKRPRESPTIATTVDAPAPPALFPSYCALCGAGGRALLQCSGSCVRAFHAACVDDVRAGNSRVATPGVRGLATTRAWRCAECARGVHACRTCGFLGHESNTLTKCSVATCGVFFHTEGPCRPASVTVDATGRLVCPRHQCDTCGVVETDMRLCESCPECFAGTHVRCSAVASTTVASTTVSLRSNSVAVATDGNLRRCDTHTVGTAVGRSVKPSADATLALQYRAHQGDLVLLLELANALLPQSATLAAPDACNQWGVVTRAEDVDGREQLLTVCVFSDGSVVSVPTRYVLVLGTANAFATPQAMVRDCIKWHAVTELNLRRTELDALAATTTAQFDGRRDAILNGSCSAFAAYATQLSLPPTQLVSAATDGFTFWTTHRTELTQFDGSGAPIYVYLDTRAPPKRADSGKSDATGDKSDDVDMDDATGGDVGGDKSDENAPVASSASSPSGRTFLHAGTSASRRPLGQGDDRSDSVAAIAASSVQTLTTNIVSATLNDVVSRIEHGAAAPVFSTSSVELTVAMPTALIAKNVAAVNDAEADDAELSHPEKCQKLTDDDDKLSITNQHQRPHRPALVPVAVVNPPPLSANVFARAKTSADVHGTATPKQPTQTRKARVLAKYSPELLQELARQAAVFLEEDANPALAKRRRKSPHPKHCDDASFPFANTAASFRPPYFRPSVVFNRAHGRRMDGLSRILLSQDKRSLKCYIQGTDENRCFHAPTATQATATATVTSWPVRSEGTFVTIDLMSVDSFRALEVVVHTRMVAAVEQDEQYLTEIFGATATRARRLFQEKRSGELAVAVYYCSYDGSRAKVVREKDDWLCFCANVCHLTAVVSVDRSRE